MEDVLLRHKSLENDDDDNDNDDNDNDDERGTTTRDSFWKAAALFVRLSSWLLFTHGALLFAMRLSQIQSEASAKTFRFAHYRYDPTDAGNTKFDTTVWTWGTDYALGILMCYFVLHLLLWMRKNDESNNSLSALRKRSAALMACYATSVFAGATSHQFYTVNTLNTLSFRILWTICVGSVTAAGGFMGEIGSELNRCLNNSNNKHDKQIPVIPQWMWIIYGVYMTTVCIAGGLSCTRPACDIFLAGTTQTFPTLYCVLVVSIHWWYSSDDDDDDEKDDKIHKGNDKLFRFVYLAGFALNCHLLPGYPLLVQYTALELGHVNALLHLNLTIAWSMQAIGLLHYCRTLEEDDVEKVNVLKIKSKDDNNYRENMSDNGTSII